MGDFKIMLKFKYVSIFIVVTLILGFKLVTNYITKHEALVEAHEQLKEQHTETLAELALLNKVKDLNEQLAKESVNKDKALNELNEQLKALMDKTITDTLDQLPEDITDEERFDIISDLAIDGLWEFYERTDSLQSNPTK